MVTKTQQVDMGFGLPEKKKKKKKKGIKEPEIQYSVLKDGYFTEASPRRSTCPSKNVVQAPEMPLVKKKKKKKKKVLSEDHPDPETVLPVRQTRKSPISQNQAPSHAELHSREKKKKGVALSALAVSHGLGVETSLNPRKGGDGTTADKKLKKHKKDKKAQNPMAFSAQKPRLSEAGVALCTCSCMLGQDGEKLAISGQKRKQGSPREQHIKMKKKRRISQDGDLPLGCLEVIRSVENSPKKGSKKKAAKTEVLDYIPIEDPKTPVKKKTKSKKQAEEADTEEPALKKKRKKKKENRVTEESCKEESDPDLEVVLEKKGNMDEAHIDQVRRKALQEEIDRESGKTEASETKKWTGTKFGQWDTAGFENEDQKLKFLKLMGGLKNLSPSLRRPPSTPDRPNMALSRRAADALQRDLQRDYERALSWKQRRGAGLGFAAAPGKVFYIDRNASRSYKFEN